MLFLAAGSLVRDAEQLINTGWFSGRDADGLKRRWPGMAMAWNGSPGAASLSRFVGSQNQYSGTLECFRRKPLRRKPGTAASDCQTSEPAQSLWDAVVGPEKSSDKCQPGESNAGGHKLFKLGLHTAGS